VRFVNKTLQLVFLNQNGSRVTISIPEPAEPIDAADVTDAMDQIIGADVIVTSGGGLATKVMAVVVSRDSEEVAVF
jgi:hypothetical protein